jgi:hypothetical protein
LARTGSGLSGLPTGVPFLAALAFDAAEVIEGARSKEAIRAVTVL